MQNFTSTRQKDTMGAKNVYTPHQTPAIISSVQANDSTKQIKSTNMTRKRRSQLLIIQASLKSIKATKHCNNHQVTR